MPWESGDPGCQHPNRPGIAELDAAADGAVWRCPTCSGRLHVTKELMDPWPRLYTDTQRRDLLVDRIGRANKPYVTYDPEYETALDRQRAAEEVPRRQRDTEIAREELRAKGWI